MNNEASNLIDILQHFDTAMLITALEDGHPNGRPMRIAESDDDGTLWFITSKATPKAAEVEDDASALVTLQSNTAHALVHGTAALVHDREKIEALWSRGAEVFFPDGPQDPEVVLVRFTPTTGQYWDLRGTKGLTYAAEAAKALWNGDSIGSVQGTSGEARLH